MRKNKTVATLMVAQGVDLVSSQKEELSYSKVNRQILTNKFQDFSLVQNFRHVWEKANVYLEQIAKSPVFKRQAALDIAKDDVNFGVQLTTAPSLSLEDRISQNYRNRGPKFQPK